MRIGQWCVLVFLLWVPLWVLIMALPASAGHGTALTVNHYWEQVGDRKQAVKWCLARGDEVRLLYHTEARTHATRADSSLNTVAWFLRENSRDTDIRVRREEDTMVIQGRLQGREIHTRAALGEAPWFQATSLSLRPFVLSEAHTTRFWMLRPDTLRPYKLSATKQGHETLDLPDGPAVAVKVQLRLVGLLAPFWRSHYWFRASDGLFVRFEGPADVTGQEMIRISYAGEGEASDCMDFFPSGGTQ